MMSASKAYPTGEAVRLRLEIKDRRWWLRLLAGVLLPIGMGSGLVYPAVLAWRQALVTVDMSLAVFFLISTVVLLSYIAFIAVFGLAFTGICPSICHSEILAPGSIERRVLWRVHRYELADARVVSPGEEWGWRFGIVLRDRFQRPFRLPFLTPAEIDLVRAYVDEANRDA